MQGKRGGTDTGHFDLATFCNAETPFDEPAHGLRVNTVLFGQHAAGEAILIIIGQHRHSSLDHDGSIVEFRRHEMYARPVQPHPSRERAPVRMQPRKSGQQRRMDIEQTPRVMPDEIFAKHPHEPGQHDQVGCVNINGSPQGVIEPVSVGIIGMRDNRRLDTLARRKRETGGIGAITDDRRDARAGNIRPDDGLHVAAPTGNKDDNGFHDAQNKNSRATARHQKDPNRWGDIPESNR